MQGLLRHTIYKSAQKHYDIPMVISPVSACLLFITEPSNFTDNLSEPIYSHLLRIFLADFKAKREHFHTLDKPENSEV